MVGLHLAREILFKPFVFLHEVLDELDRQLAFNLDCRLAVLRVVEPRLCKPAHSESVGIDADRAGYVETLDVYIPVGKGVNQTLAQYGLLIVFFFKSSLSDERKIC